MAKKRSNRKLTPFERQMATEIKGAERKLLLAKKELAEMEAKCLQREAVAAREVRWVHARCLEYKQMVKVRKEGLGNGPVIIKGKSYECYDGGVWRYRLDAHGCKRSARCVAAIQAAITAQSRRGDKVWFDIEVGYGSIGLLQECTKVPVWGLTICAEKFAKERWWMYVQGVGRRMYEHDPVYYPDEFRMCVQLWSKPQS